MAMGKNKTGIMAAITAAAEQTPSARAERTLPRGTIGSVRAGMGGIQDIDTDLILPWGPQDRLGVELTAVNSDESVADLTESMRASGQQVPVLLRPAPSQDGKFEVIYGRRRILACRSLGIPVRALIRTLDDTEALMAKGLENASRTDLSFYERARFAKAILAQDHTRAQVCEALAISKNTLSQLERITRLVPDDLGDGIGAAPGAGRPKWMALASALEKGSLTVERAMIVLSKAPEGATSDDRFDLVTGEIGKRGARQGRAQVRSPAPGVTIKNGSASLSVSVAKTKNTAAFAEWLDRHFDSLITESFERFKSETDEGQGS